MLILKSEKVPNEPAHDFQQGKCRDKELVVFLQSKEIIEKEVVGPGESKNQILNYGKEVIARV